MDIVRWGIIGCGDVTEVKSGPALQKAQGSALVAVMRRDVGKAEDYARRHGVPRVHATAAALVADPDVDAVYVATPPSSHLPLARLAAAAGKPCLVEKPMARTHAECLEMIEAFRAGLAPLFVAYYRRALPRFVHVRQLLLDAAIGRPTSVHIVHYAPLAAGDAAKAWRFDPAVAGAGLFLDLASHGLDLLDWFFGPAVEAHGVALNTGGTYAAEDVVSASMAFSSGVAGTGVWNFNASHTHDEIVVTGTAGELRTPVFGDADVVLARGSRIDRFPFERPSHVHQPLVQAIVDELRGRGRSPSSGESGARTTWVMDRCLEAYRRTTPPLTRPGA